MIITESILELSSICTVFQLLLAEIITHIKHLKLYSI